MLSRTSGVAGPGLAQSTFPVPAHPLSRPQCHNRFSYMPPESSPAAQQDPSTIHRETAESTPPPMTYGTGPEREEGGIPASTSTDEQLPFPKKCEYVWFKEICDNAPTWEIKMSQISFPIASPLRFPRLHQESRTRSRHGKAQQQLAYRSSAQRHASRMVDHRFPSFQKLTAKVC